MIMEFNVTAGIFNPFAMKREKKSPLWKTNYITLMNNAYTKGRKKMFYLTMHYSHFI